MQIIGLQLDAQWEAPDANLSRVEGMLEKHAQRDALVVLPEMFATGFTMNTTAAVGAFETIRSHVLTMAKQHGVWIVAGAAAAGSTGPENLALVMNSGGEIARYAKLHPFSLGGEKEHYRAGERVITFDWQGFTVAPFVCYDLRFPEIFRAAAKRGATLFTVIANWPISRAEHWLTLLRARAIENQAYVIGVNRVGRDPNTLYGGRSILVDPTGVVRCDAGDGETALRCDVDPGVVTKTRIRYPFLTDRRSDF